MCNIVEIYESGIKFSVEKDELFHIEKSNNFKKLGIKTVEFVKYQKISKQIMFIEAKSSIPNPEKSPSEYEEFWNEIKEKHENSFNYIASSFIRFPERSSEFSESFKNILFQDSKILLFLIIPDMPNELLSGASDKFNKKLDGFKKAWGVNDIVVINKELAKKYGLISM